MREKAVVVEVQHDEYREGAKNEDEPRVTFLFKDVKHLAAAELRGVSKAGASGPVFF